MSGDAYENFDGNTLPVCLKKTKKPCQYVFLLCSIVVELNELRYRKQLACASNDNYNGKNKNVTNHLLLLLETTKYRIHGFSLWISFAFLNTISLNPLLFVP